MSRRPRPPAGGPAAGRPRPSTRDCPACCGRRTTLEGLREQVRRREVLSPEFAVDAMALAGVCSQRIGERELGGWGVEALSEQAVELHALAEAVDAVLDLGEALRALEWIASAPAPRTLERRIGATIEAGR